MKLPEQCCFKCKHGDFLITPTGRVVRGEKGQCLYSPKIVIARIMRAAKNVAPESFFGSIDQISVSSHGVEPSDGQLCEYFEDAE